MSKLHIFDMDGTLLAGSACLGLSEQMDQLTAVNEIEERWGRGEVGHVAFYELCIPLWEGMEPTHVEAAFRTAAWMQGIQEVWGDIARRGEYSAVVTLSPQFFAERLLEWGVTSAHGARVEAGLAVEPHLVLTPDSKVTVLEELLERYGLGDEDCVAYGDSASDIPLFARLQNTVAVNGSESLRKIAAVSCDGQDLRPAYEAGRALLRQAPTAEVGR
jgi:phosphoserine phosphatase